MASDMPERPSLSPWTVELPRHEAIDSEFGNCRGIEHSYRKLDQVGEGTYGEVYLGEDKRTRERVALKKIRMDNEKEGFPITAIREIKLLKRLDDRNVINLKEIVRSQAHHVNNMKGSIYMVFDYMDHDLTGLMERRGYKMEVSHIKCYMKQLVKGLAFCHNKTILHRDLKASNLLINNEGNLKIADFGLARTKDHTTQGRLTNKVVTLWYRPPELLLGATDYGPEIDMWSVGCIFAELLVGRPLFPGVDEADQLDRICKIMGSPTEATMPGVSKLPNAHVLHDRYKENRLIKHMHSKKITDSHALDLLAQLLALDPNKRIKAEDAIGHSYFWTEPMPAHPSQLPKYADSHELDMKKLREPHKHKAAGHTNQGPDPKRARHVGAHPNPHEGQRMLPPTYDQRRPVEPQRMAQVSGHGPDPWNVGGQLDGRYREQPPLPSGPQPQGIYGNYTQHMPYAAPPQGSGYPPAVHGMMHAQQGVGMPPHDPAYSRQPMPQQQAYRGPPPPRPLPGLNVNVPSWKNQKR